jgi:Histidine kinase
MPLRERSSLTSSQADAVRSDLHDILGHSLTVLTVKAELAGRLVSIDPERAGQEIAEVEQLARQALADVGPPSRVTARRRCPGSSPRPVLRSTPPASLPSFPARWTTSRPNGASCSPGPSAKA